MGIKWATERFGNLYASPSRNGLTKPSRVRGEGYKFINMGEIFAYDRMMNIPCERVPLTEKEQETSLLEESDLLFARQSLVLSGAGKCSIFLGDDEPVAFESHLIRARLDQKIVNPEFLYYFFNSPHGRAEMWSIIEQGAGQAGIRGSDLAKLNIPVPSLQNQQAIAETLSILDDKIELNRQMNVTLEQMAQALFTSWFVDFDPVIDNALDAGNPIPEELEVKAEQRKQLREAAAKGEIEIPALPDDIRVLFPSTFEFTEEMGWIPKGWEGVQAKDLCAKVQNGSTPRRMNSDYWEDGSINWFKSGELSDSVLLQSGEKITEKGLQGSSCKLWPAGTVLIAIYAAPTVGRLGVLSEQSTSNQACTGLVPLENIGPYYIFYTLFNAREWLNTIAVGAAQQNISKTVVETVPCLKPSQGVLDRFNEFAVSMWASIDSNKHQASQLENLRNTLLPRLISGELQIPDAEKLVTNILN